MNRNRLITRLVGILPSITLVLSCWSPTCVAQTAVTPKGYWKYLSHEVKPRPEEAPKALPGHLLEARATGSVDIPGGKAMLASVWKTDDVDRKPFTMEGSFGISASQTLAALVPGTKVTLQGSGDVTGNSNAASLPANGRFTVGVDNADFVFEISDVKVSHSGSGKGEFTVHNAQPGEKMVITLSSYLASMGAYSSRMVIQYEMVAGTPPANLGAVSSATGAGTSGGTSGNMGTNTTGASSATTGSGKTGSGSGTASAGSGTVGTATSSGAGSSANPVTDASEPAAVATMTLQAGKRRVQQGQNVTVPIWLLKAQSVANMNFNVRYDSSVAKPTGAFSKGNLLDKSLFEANTAEAGNVLIGFAQNADIAGDGTVVQLTFQANGAPGTRTPLTLEVTTVSGAGGGKPGIALIHGEILIVGKDGALPGDSDGDNQITARDAGDALKMSVKLIPVKLVCDFDRDGQVTSTDARLILAKASGK